MVDLQRGDLTVFVSPGSRGVDAYHQEVRRVVHRFEICAERGAVPPIRAAQARPQIEERDVVVAWNGQHCRPQEVHERACRAELRAKSAPMAWTTAPCSVPKCVSEICSSTLIRQAPRCLFDAGPGAYNGSVGLWLQQIEWFGEHAEVGWRAHHLHFAIEGHLHPTAAMLPWPGVPATVSSGSAPNCCSWRTASAGTAGMPCVRAK
jgi:hypothetical protein